MQQLHRYPGESGMFNYAKYMLFLIRGGRKLKTSRALVIYRYNDCAMLMIKQGRSRYGAKTKSLRKIIWRKI